MYRRDTSADTTFEMPATTFGALRAALINAGEDMKTVSEYDDDVLWEAAEDAEIEWLEVEVQIEIERPEPATWECPGDPGNVYPVSVYVVTPVAGSRYPQWTHGPEIIDNDLIAWALEHVSAIKDTIDNAAEYDDGRDDCDPDDAPECDPYYDGS